MGRFTREDKVGLLSLKTYFTNRPKLCMQPAMSITIELPGPSFLTL